MENLVNPKNSNIARPYALAAFEYARDQEQLPMWKSFLEAAAYIARDAGVSKLLQNPEVTSDKLFDFFQGLLKTLLDTERQNFLLLLAQNKRLIVLPEIYELFNSYYTALQKISNVRVITAIDIEEEFRQKLMQTLAKRIHHEVTLQCEVNPTILGGAIIHIGDRVIDGSIRGKLNRLLTNLTS